ncbi:lipase/esterase [Pseudopedobacter saltans DSM 12145]|uniref:Lipase/esterase n=1 Tax=Pseudopedobacter saltans (strain ATCC 51119 / DSM 12145 / JCM 21818 / CCUG 39354 / LMG 10337 / NBRC 100064 / NCIMB 13643) TaxID=762903 RepID=F0S4I2_PSESL|nr:alpha/beta hydrolase [Pseudopedobacter saltans]ADY51973.1 lipase/esterase [Pseudopedobacter saltans DSM 12145]
MDKSRINKGLLEILEHVPNLNIPHDVFKNNPQQIRAQRRQIIQKTLKKAPENIEVENITIKGSKESHQVSIRTYSKNGLINAPVLLYFHSGGFVVGEPEQMDAAIFKLLSLIDYVVISVNYRKAPEHPFPAAVEDAFAALYWIYTKAEQILSLDRTKIVVAGASAGGNIAAALTLMSRDYNGPEISYQVLIYPAITPATGTSSKQEFTDSPVWDSINSNIGWIHYLGEQTVADPENVSPYANLLNASLDRLPPAFITVCGLDPLRDEGIDYAKKPLTAKVPVSLEVIPDAVHVFDAFPCKLSDRFFAKQVELYNSLFKV